MAKLTSISPESQPIAKAKTTFKQKIFAAIKTFGQALRDEMTENGSISENLPPHLDEETYISQQTKL